MNLSAEAQEKGTLYEVIYPAADGNIYFLDPDTGNQTRGAIRTGYPVRGTATLDPRGYPLLYVEQGGEMTDGSANSCLYVYSLLDGQLLYKQGAETSDDFARRSTQQDYASCPLVAADADTLIWLGESGALNTVRLNTDFNRAAGMVSISPEQPVEYRYATAPSADDPQAGGDASRLHWTVSAAAAWKNYLYFADNGGLLQCVDLNTMTPVFVQDLDSPTQAALLLERDGDSLSLYTATSVSGDTDGSGTCEIRKINALTGEILWEKPYECSYTANIPAGAIASPALGTESLDGMVYFTLAGTADSAQAGQIVALDANSGEAVWTHTMEQPALSSPAILFAADEAGLLLQADVSGKLTLLDAKTGEALDSLETGSPIDASPALFGNIAVMGGTDGKVVAALIK